MVDLGYVVGEARRNMELIWLGRLHNWATKSLLHAWSTWRDVKALRIALSIIVGVPIRHSTCAPVTDDIERHEVIDPRRISK